MVVLVCTRVRAKETHHFRSFTKMLVNKHVRKIQIKRRYFYAHISKMQRLRGTGGVLRPHLRTLPGMFTEASCCPGRSPAELPRSRQGRRSGSLSFHV